MKQVDAINTNVGDIKKRKRLSPGAVIRTADTNLEVIRTTYPELDKWRNLALKWLNSNGKITRTELMAVSYFLERYIIGKNLPTEPTALLQKNASLPDFFTSICPQSSTGAHTNNIVHKFINHVISEDLAIVNDDGTTSVNENLHNPIPHRNTTTLLPAHKMQQGTSRDSDSTFSWISKKHPQIEPWRILASEWLAGITHGLGQRITALATFMEKFIIEQALPLDPAIFLSRSTLLPDFYKTICQESKHGISRNNHVHAFLDWVLLRNFAEEDDFGRRVVSSEFHNPIQVHSLTGLPRLDESVHSPLPYGYIDSLRQIIASGPTFSDWTWAQNSLGADIGQGGMTAPDWFPVTESQIDKDDPDCVFRVRNRLACAGGPVLEMWSPVRWVALLIKLLLPLRTFQVRMLDSGEADTWRYQNGKWVKNDSRLAQGNERKARQQGVFRRFRFTNQHVIHNDISNPNIDDSVELYINTNKTADAKKTGTEKGFTLPWPMIQEPLHQNVYYWLEKLRNWQEKYNPITRPTSWSELDSRHMDVKSDFQLASYPDTCFLFRLPEARSVDSRSFPCHNNTLTTSWFALLKYMEEQLVNMGENHADGSRICLVQEYSDGDTGKGTHFPLHSLRVSMVTALALEGRVPFPILAKVVGHSRLLMTLYYTKPGVSEINQYIADGAARLEANKEKSIIEFLRNTEHAKLVETAIANNKSTLASVVPTNPANRNPAGWQDMGYGICLVGGNISELEENKKVGGCFNGGPRIGPDSMKCNSPVPGGARNCVRCRFFVTGPQYVPALCARWNNNSYHGEEAASEAVAKEAALNALKDERFDALQAGKPFEKANEFRKVERLCELAMSRWSDLQENMAACMRLIVRCLESLKSTTSDMQLVSVGTLMDVKAEIDGTDSELLQLSGVCEDLEIYPDLDAGKAILRRSQLLDAALATQGKPPLCMLLSEKEQLRVGNAVMRHLAHSMNPSHPEIGRREVVSILEAGERFSERLGLNLDALLANATNQNNPSLVTKRGVKGVLYNQHSS